MSIEKLLKQKTAIENQIIKAKLVQKNQARVEKLVLKLLQKHLDIFVIDTKILEKSLNDFLYDTAKSHAKNRT
jgi:hypothetical protein